MFPQGGNVTDISNFPFPSSFQNTEARDSREQTCRRISKHEHNSKWKLLQFEKSRSTKNWANCCSQPDTCCFVGWEFSYRINCLQNTHFEKTDTYVDRKYGHVRPALSSILGSFSSGRRARWLVAYWWYPWSGFLQATPFSFRRFLVSIDSEPCSDNSGSICSCCSPTPFPSHK